MGPHRRMPCLSLGEGLVDLSFDCPHVDHAPYHCSVPGYLACCAYIRIRVCPCHRDARSWSPLERARDPRRSSQLRRSPRLHEWTRRVRGDSHTSGEACSCHKTRTRVVGGEGGEEYHWYGAARRKRSKQGGREEKHAGRRNGGIHGQVARRHRGASVPSDCEAE